MTKGSHKSLIENDIHSFLDFLNSFGMFNLLSQITVRYNESNEESILLWFIIFDMSLEHLEDLNFRFAFSFSKSIFQIIISSQT